jgi:serine/threonine protein kinase
MQSGYLIQNYRLVRKLGEGGMGEVWLGVHTQFERQVAVKCLNPTLFRNPRVRSRFRQEAVALAKLQHPNIVALLDYYEDELGAYLVLEYVPGLPLDEYIATRSGPIPSDRLLAFLRQMLAGIAFAHANGIVHRDIKPSNFMVSDAGDIKVLDFGIAKILDTADHKLTKTGTHLGTVLYMSPEQVKGEAVDPRTDIYSLGVTLFQMATGQCPYHTEQTEFWVYNQIVNAPLPNVRAIYPGVSPQVEALIAAATAKSPAQRFQTCADFLKAVEQPDFGLQQVPVAAHSPGPQAVFSHAAGELGAPPARRTRMSLRTRLFIWAGAAIFFLCLAGVGILIFRNIDFGDSGQDTASQSNSSTAQPTTAKTQKRKQSQDAKAQAAAERRERERQAAAEAEEKKRLRGTVLDQLEIGHDGYSIGVLGGISGLVIVVANNSDFLFDQIDVTVFYIKADGGVYDQRTVSFGYLGAHDSARLRAPDMERGSEVAIRISSARSSALEYCYLDDSDRFEDIDDPYYCQ